VSAPNLATTDAAIDEMWERAAERGYILASEIEELHDPLLRGESWMEDAAAEARDRGIHVVDDLAPGEEKPEIPTTMAKDPVRLYLNQAARHALLTAEEEMDLAKRYQAGLDAEKILNGAAKLTPKKKALLNRIRVGGAASKERLIRSNLRLVVPTAKKYAGRDLDLIELIQEGNLGLIRAVEKFDHTKGYKFSTYAVWWIRQAVQRGVASKARAIRLPVNVWETASKLRRAEVDLRQQLGRDPNEAEVAEYCDLSVERVREVKEALRDAASLDRPVGEDGDATLGDLIKDDEAIDPEQAAAALDMRSRLLKALQDLDERERTILELRFGLIDGHEHSLDEIGARFGLSRERIRQLQKQALTKLRHPAANHELGHFFETLAA